MPLEGAVHSTNSVCVMSPELSALPHPGVPKRLQEPRLYRRWPMHKDAIDFRHRVIRCQIADNFDFPSGQVYLTQFGINRGQDNMPWQKFGRHFKRTRDDFGGFVEFTQQIICQKPGYA